MTELRKRFIEDLQLQGKSERTQQAYVRAVRMLAQHCNTSPDKLTEEHLRQYFLYVMNEKKWSFSTMNQALCAIKCFYTQTLQQDWRLLDLIRPPKEQKLPDVLTREEVRQILHAVRRLRYPVCLTTIYSCGLRRTDLVKECDISNTQTSHIRKDLWPSGILHDGSGNGYGCSHLWEISFEGFLFGKYRQRMRL